MRYGVRNGFKLAALVGLVACAGKSAEDDEDTGASGEGEQAGSAAAVAAAVCAWTPPVQVALDLTQVQPMGTGFVGIQYGHGDVELVRLGPAGNAEARFTLGADVAVIPGAIALSVHGDQVIVARAIRDDRTGEDATHIDVDVLDDTLEVVASATIQELHRNNIQYVQLQAGPSDDGWWVVWSMQRISTTDEHVGRVYALGDDLSVLDDHGLDIGTAASAGPGGPFVQTINPLYGAEDAPRVDDYALRSRATDAAGLPTGEWTDLGAGHVHPTAMVATRTGALAAASSTTRLGREDDTLWALGSDGAAIASEALGSTIMSTTPLAPLAGGALLSWWDVNDDQPLPRLEAIGADGERLPLSGFPVGVVDQVFYEPPSVATSDEAIVLWWYGDRDETWLSRCER